MLLCEPHLGLGQILIFDNSLLTITHTIHSLESSPEEVKKNKPPQPPAMRQSIKCVMGKINLEKAGNVKGKRLA
jgi:hypothetical protein